MADAVFEENSLNRPIIEAELITKERKNAIGELVSERIWRCKYLRNTPDEEITRINELFPDESLYEETD